MSYGDRRLSGPQVSGSIVQVVVGSILRIGPNGASRTSYIGVREYRYSYSIRVPAQKADSYGLSWNFIKFLIALLTSAAGVALIWWLFSGQSGHNANIAIGGYVGLVMGVISFTWLEELEEGDTGTAITAAVIGALTGALVGLLYAAIGLGVAGTWGLAIGITLAALTILSGSLLLAALWALLRTPSHTLGWIFLAALLVPLCDWALRAPALHPGGVVGLATAGAVAFAVLRGAFWLYLAPRITRAAGTGPGLWLVFTRMIGGVIDGAFLGMTVWGLASMFNWDIGSWFGLILVCALAGVISAWWQAIILLSQRG